MRPRTAAAVHILVSAYAATQNLLASPFVARNGRGLVTGGRRERLCRRTPIWTSRIVVIDSSRINNLRTVIIIVIALSVWQPYPELPYQGGARQKMHRLNKKFAFCHPHLASSNPSGNLVTIDSFQEFARS